METKSEMINRIAELAKENAELKAENDRLKSRNKLYKKIITENIRKSKNQIMVLNACIKGDLSVEEVKEYAKLEIENERLKEDIKFYNSQLSMRVVMLQKANSCLQEIKAIAEENKDTAQYGGICKSILMIITKAEEE